MEKIFDSHAHYDDEAFDSDRDEVLCALPALDIGYVLNCGTDIASSLKSTELAEKYDFIYAAVGIHPHDAQKASDGDFEKIKDLLNHKKVVAVGEIGLDYHYDFSPRDVQQKVFERQLEIAVQSGYPVIVHDREAHEDALNLLKRYKPKGVVHCFSGSVEMAREVVKLGMFIGLGGSVTFKNAVKPVEVAAYVPLENLLIETDAPYMTPSPFRGRRCTSEFTVYSAQKIAEIKKLKVDELIKATRENALTLFSINE